MENWIKINTYGSTLGNSGQAGFAESLGANGQNETMDFKDELKTQIT